MGRSVVSGAFYDRLPVKSRQVLAIASHRFSGPSPSGCRPHVGRSCATVFKRGVRDPFLPIWTAGVRNDPSLIARRVVAQELMHGGRAR